MIEAKTLEAFQEALDGLRPGWVITGDTIAGPLGAEVRLTERHESTGAGHVDVQCVFDTSSPTPLEFWDCVSGAGETDVERAQFAAKVWSQTTACTLFELKYSLRGEYADHFRGNDPLGFTGWHAIWGAIGGFGDRDTYTKLQEWWIENPVLPTLARALAPSLSKHDRPFGLKIFFGGDGIAEVRFNGDYHEAASIALAGLPWPRFESFGYVRSYVLVVHRETEEDQC